MRSLKFETTLHAIVVLLLLMVTPGALAANLLSKAKKLAQPAQAYPELKQINDQVGALIKDMETNSGQLTAYRKARIRATDRRYSALTRAFNQSRTRLSEIERRLDKAPPLDVNRFPSPTVSDRGGSPAYLRREALSGEIKKYDQARASLKQSLKALSDYYDQQLREIAKLH
jgi:hypothetical protein